MIMTFAMMKHKIGHLLRTANKDVVEADKLLRHIDDDEIRAKYDEIRAKYDELLAKIENNIYRAQEMVEELD